MALREPHALRTVSVDTATSRRFDSSRPSKRRAPIGRPGALEQCAVAAREYLIIRRSVGTTQLQRNMAAGFAWARNNARANSRCRLSRDGDIAELLVF